MITNPVFQIRHVLRTELGALEVSLFSRQLDRPAELPGVSITQENPDGSKDELCLTVYEAQALATHLVKAARAGLSATLGAVCEEERELRLEEIGGIISDSVPVGLALGLGWDPSEPWRNPHRVEAHGGIEAARRSRKIQLNRKGECDVFEAGDLAPCEDIECPVHGREADPDSWASE